LEGSPRIGRSKTVVENARVDQIGTQTTEQETIFYLALLYFIT
jgi:hypothetical protein